MAHIDWETFIHDGLLKHGVVTGAAVLTFQGVCVSSYGSLGNINEESWLQFRGLFNNVSEKGDDEVFRLGFKLKFVNSPEMHFRVYKKTYCSVYATSNETSDGLIVCNLPYGLLVCTYSSSHSPGHTITVVEQFCDKLRA